ncbi:MAG: dTMP kinase [Alphaproteobacteria bacterium]|nr:dTMP kinase [Alphaproteobacteria bacterium]
MKQGLFITFEGGEGSGKSTQLELFAAYLRTEGYDVVITREPGSTSVGKEIRRLLVEGTKDKFDEITETLLFYADRRLNLTQIVWPALAEGKIVLSDRFNDSTIAYQYYGANKLADRQILDTLYNTVAGSFKPDLTFLLDIDAHIGLARSFRKAETMSTKEIRFEQAEISFHERLRNGYLELAKQEPERFYVISGDKTKDAIQHEIQQAFKQKFHP